jgi:hypothetical protein
MSILTKSIDFPHYKITGNQKKPISTIENLQALFDALLRFEKKSNGWIFAYLDDEYVCVGRDDFSVITQIFNPAKDSLFLARLKSTINKYQLPVSIINFLESVDISDSLSEVSE